MTRSLIIQESTREVKSAASVTRLHRDTTHTLRAPTPGYFRLELPTVEGVQGSIFLWGIRRRKGCHGPRAYQRNLKSGAIIARGVRDKIYLTLGLSWSSLSDRTSMSQSWGLSMPTIGVPLSGVYSNPRYFWRPTDRIVHWPSSCFSVIHWSVSWLNEA